MTVIRKKTGNFLEDFRIGEVLRHKVGKTVTEGLFNAFTEFSMTTNPLHKNRRYAQAYGFRDMIVPPGLVMAVVFSQSVEDISENARANLEYVDMRFGAPVYIGDTLESDVGGPGREPVDPRPRASASSTCRPPAATSTATSCSRSSAKSRSGRTTPTREVVKASTEAPPVPCALVLPPYDPARPYRDAAPPQ